MNASRAGLVVLLVVLAVTLQTAVFSLFSVNGVVPNLALLVVVAAAIARGPAFGASRPVHSRCRQALGGPLEDQIGGPFASLVDGHHKGEQIGMHRAETLFVRQPGAQCLDICIRLDRQERPFLRVVLKQGAT